MTPASRARMRIRYVLAFMLAGCAAELTPGPEGDDDIVEPILDENDTFAADAKADSLNTTATYYSIRRDYRKCAWPDCGGWWVSRVNRSWTQCHDNAWRDACYVVDQDTRGLGLGEEETNELQSLMEQGRIVVRGRIFNKVYAGKRRGQFRTTEAWQASSDAAPTGTFYKVTDRGLVCVYSPCPSYHEAKLNSTDAADVHALGFGTLGDEATVNRAWTALDAGPILVAGDHSTFIAPLSGNRGTSLDASQYYTRFVGDGLRSYAPQARELGGLSFVDPTDARPPYPRTYRFERATWNVSVEDAVAPCPAGATCFWSGIVTRQAVWSLSGDRVRLAYAEGAAEGDGFGIKYYAELAVRKDAEGRLVLVEIQDDGQSTDRRYRIAE
jgi:hypothetical protein